MSHIFISYSRKDLDFAQKIVNALAANDLDTWIDWKSIPKGEDWEQEIYRGIEEADAFLFLISSDSVISEICNKEIAHAVANGKRILPNVIRDADTNEFLDEVAKSEISKRNWIFCREGQDDFEKAIAEIHETIHTDYEWLKYHTRLQVKALEWERTGDTSRLLRGKELREAEEQLTIAGSAKDPQPTNLQREYFLVSTKDERRRRNRIIAISVVAGIAMVVLGAYAQYQGNLAIDQAATAQAASTREAEQAQTAQAASTLAIQEANQRATAQVEAEQQARISRAGELAAIVALKRDNEIDLSLLLSVEAINFLDNYRTRANLLSALQAKPNPRQVLRKHSLSVSSIAYHPNGKMIASGGLDGQILLWDTITGKTIGKPIEVMKNIEPHLTFSPDGSILAFSDCDEIDDTYSFNVTCKTPVIILWDIAKKQEIRRFTVPNNNFIIKLEFSPDGNFIGSGSLGTVLLWDIVRGEVDDEIRVHPPFDFAFSPEGNILVASDCIETYADLSGIWCGNSALVVMDLSSPQREKHIFEGHRGWFDKLAFSPDGKWLVAGHRNSSSLSVWSVVDHTPKQVNIERQATAKITDIAFYYHGRTMIMATSQSDGNITLWDVPIIFRPTGRVLSGHVGSVNGLDFSPDGNVLATAGQDASIILWDLQNESVIKTPLQPEFSADTDAVAWDIDEKSLITVSSDSIYFWDIQSGNRTWKDLVDIQNVNRVSSFPERIVKFSLDSKTIAIGEGTMLRIWDVFTGEPVDLYFTHQSVVDTLTNVKDIAFRPNGNILAVGYDNGSLIFWDSATRKSIGEPILVGMGVNAIAFSPNGNTLASGDLSGTVSLWDVVTHEQVGQLRKAEDFLPEVVNIAFSSNGRLLASVDGSGAVTLWNVKTLEQIAAPRLDTNNAVLTVIFTPDNSTLISGSSGGTVMMWDMSSRQPIGELIGHTNAVNLISINPDGNLAVTSDAGGAMFLWDISIHSWVDKACGMVSRNLSQVEWQQYFPDEEYRITCPQWPAGE